MKSQTKHITHLIRQNINDLDPQADVILFGSRARGDEGKDSDWDILILTDYPADLRHERMFRQKLYDLELETGESFSVLVYSKSDWDSRQRITPFYENVTKEGIAL